MCWAGGKQASKGNAQMKLSQVGRDGQARKGSEEKKRGPSEIRLDGWGRLKRDSAHKGKKSKPAPLLNFILFLSVPFSLSNAFFTPSANTFRGQHLCLRLSGLGQIEQSASSLPSPGRFQCECFPLEASDPGAAPASTHFFAARLGQSNPINQKI